MEIFSVEEIGKIQPDKEGQLPMHHLTALKHEFSYKNP
tara:strand:- start:832 stop:945 length:114 start_codon:yes stop_codon:yes gene_type:complete